jgi:hypothetical protein
MFLSPKSQILTLTGQATTLPIIYIPCPEDTLLLLLSAKVTAFNGQPVSNSNIHLEYYDQNNILTIAVPNYSAIGPAASAIIYFLSNLASYNSGYGRIWSPLPYPIIVNGGKFAFNWLLPHPSSTLSTSTFYCITL